MSQLRKLLPVPRRAWTARELLPALLDCGDVCGFEPNGDARVVFTVAPELLEELCAWDDAGENELIDDAAQTRFGGSA